MTQKHTFSDWISRFLNDSTQSQAQIEQAMGVSKGTLSKWKNDEVGSPRRENLKAFADVLHLRTADLALLMRTAGYQVSLDAVLDSPEYATARKAYLQTMRVHYGTLRPHAFTALAKDNRAGQVRQLPLVGNDGMFVPLRFDVISGKEKRVEGHPTDEKTVALAAEREKREWLLPDILQLPGQLAIIGDAGCGKTTLLHVIATALADPQSAALADVQQSFSAPSPLPVFVPLRFFEYDCSRGRYERTLADLLRFVDDWFGRWSRNGMLPDKFLAQHIESGRACLLLDALDEVADPDHRKTMRFIIEQLAQNYPETHIIVTARVSGYRGVQLNDDFSLVQVQDLDDGQRLKMLQVIYHGLDIENAEARAQKLTARFKTEPLAQLGRTPVMVWTAGIIEALRGKLPETRAALYNEYTDMLLRHSFKENEYDTAALDAIRGDERWSVEDRLDHLCYLAFKVHQFSEPQGRADKKEQHPLDEGDLVDKILAPRFLEWGLVDTSKRNADKQARTLAHEFLTVMVEHSGLIYEPTPGNYTIGDHLTMQEFLAGRYLVDALNVLDPAGYDSFLQEKLGHSWWREVLELGVGFLADTRSSIAKGFLEQLTERGHTPVEQLTALTATANAMLPLRHRQQPPGWYKGLGNKLAGKLYSLLYATQPPDASVQLKQNAGLALGKLYGYANDPRFAHPGGLPAFIKLPAGSFWMGEDDSDQNNEKPRHKVYLDEFELAKYPTTNAMFARFIADDGYGNPDWWQIAIADKCWANGILTDWLSERTQPAYWDDIRFNNSAQPVVGVTWYEAVAYCAWLTATQTDGYHYYLPTEAQWERAARGRFGLTSEGEIGRYPWGDTWQPDKANSGASGLDTTSPVGLFPPGETSDHILDMVGNVWEWCADWYEKDYYRSGKVRNPQGPQTGKYKVLRGGSWRDDDPAEICRVGCRSWDFPIYWINIWGFRCARNLSEGS